MPKEFMSEDRLQIEALKTKIWSMFDILRSESIFSEDYHVLLYLLSAYKDGLITTDILSENADLKEKLISNLRSAENDLANQYLSIGQTFEPIIMRFSWSGLSQLIQTLIGINNKELSEFFPEIFDSVLYRISQSQGRYGGEFIQPIEITRFICSLTELKPQSKVYNPFAGLASFGVFLNQDHYYFGQEINQKTWALGALRIMAYDRTDNSQYVCDDSILHWPAPSELFDLIVANPPFRMRLGNQYRYVGSDIGTIEHFLIKKAVHSLKTTGKLITLLPQGVLYSSGLEQNLRKYLIESDLIDTIIALPGGLLLNTGIPLVIMVLSRNKKISGKVRFIDAKKFVVSKSLRGKILDDSGLSNVFQGKNNDLDVIRIVSNENIRLRNYDLSVSRYFQKEVEGVLLSDILELIRGQRVNVKNSGKLIRIRDLKDDKFDFKLDISNVESTEFRRPYFQQVSESCLLLATRWRTLKPTYFEFKGESIFRNQDILSFKVNESIVDIKYLINELHADYVKEQIESCRLGDSIPFIRREDLLAIKVKLPSIELQRAKIQGMFELSTEIKNLQVERNAIVHGKTVKHYAEFASLKHTIGGPRQNILDWADNLHDFLIMKPEGFEVLNKKFTKFYDIDIISALKEIKRDINFITDVLEKGENGLVLSEYVKQIIPLSDINIILNELSNNSFNFKITKLLLEGEKLKDRGIYSNKTLFKILLDNILTNANKHAFDKKKSSGNEVVIELTEVDDFLSLEIRNNGKPFPKNFDREKFITKYSTADSSKGEGLGGYDIHRIATDFNNPDWILSLNEDPFFLVKFKFQFPIKLIN